MNENLAIPQGMDAGSVNLARAIRKQESGGNYQQYGDDNSSYGAYQWNNQPNGKSVPLAKGEIPSNFKSNATKYNLDPNDFSPTNQDMVAYNVIKGYRDQGYNVPQIAALWNGGDAKRSDPNYVTPSGLPSQKKDANGKDVYNVPQYAQNVNNYYQDIKNQTGGGYNPTPYSTQGNNPGAIDFTGATPPAQTETAPSLIPNLGEIGTNLSTGLSSRVKDFGGALQPLMKGDVFSAGLQGAGAIAGGIGDIATAALGLIPGVQGAEKLLGSGVKAVLNTQTGKDMATAFSNFAQENPTIAKDIGAGVNVLAAIPILKGFGLVKRAVMDASTAAFKKSVLTSAEAEIKDNLTARPAAALARAQARGANPIPTMLENPSYLPEVVANPSGGFMYNASKARGALQTSLSADEAVLQAKLDGAIKKNIMVSIADTEKKVLADIRKANPLSVNYLSMSNAVKDIFKSLKASSGGRNMISLNELNGIKRNVRNAVFDVAGDVRGSATAQIKYDIGQSLMDQVETIAKKAGIDGVPEINKTMGTKIEALKVLDAMDGRKVVTKGGLGREVAVDVAGAVGEGAGNMFGIPFAGTLASRGLVGKILRSSPRTEISKLTSYKGNPIKTAKKGLLQVGKGVVAQQTVR